MIVSRFSLYTDSTQQSLWLVYAGFCCDKHPAVALVPAEVWQEDGGLLRHHSESPLFLFGSSPTAARGAAPFDVGATLWMRLAAMRHGRLVDRRDARRVLCVFVTFYHPSLSLPPSTVDHALHRDAGSHPQRGGGLRGGRLLWAQRGCVTFATMVRVFPRLSYCR